MNEIICLIAGTLLGAGITVYVLQKKKWPEKLQQMEEEVEVRVKQETLQQSATTVQPVMGNVISQIQEVVNIVEDAVLELIVRFQEITDDAIQDANQTAAELSHTSDDENGDANDRCGRYRGQWSVYTYTYSSNLPIFLWASVFC